MIRTRVAIFRRSMRALARMFSVSVADVVPRLSTETLRHLEWRLAEIPAWLLRDERYAVTRELLARDMAAIAAREGGWCVTGEETWQ